MELTGIVVAILVIALIGFLVYLVTTYIPMPAPFKQVIIVVVVILLVLYLLALLTGSAGLPRIR